MSSCWGSKGQYQSRLLRDAEAFCDAGNESDFSVGVSGFVYPSSLAVEVSRSFGSVEGTRDYRMVALPGEVSIPLSSTLEGTAR